MLVFINTNLTLHLNFRTPAVNRLDCLYLYIVFSHRLRLKKKEKLKKCISDNIGNVIVNSHKTSVQIWASMPSP